MAHSPEYDSPLTEPDYEGMEPEAFFEVFPEAKGLSEEDFRRQYEDLPVLADRIYSH